MRTKTKSEPQFCGEVMRARQPGFLYYVKPGETLKVCATKMNIGSAPRKERLKPELIGEINKAREPGLLYFVKGDAVSLRVYAVKMIRGGTKGAKHHKKRGRK